MKNLRYYETEYKKAVSPVKSGELAVKPEIWIAARWEVDNGVDFPGSKIWLDKIQAVRQADPELARVILAGEEMMKKIMTEE